LLSSLHLAGFCGFIIRCWSLFSRWYSLQNFCLQRMPDVRSLSRFFCAVFLSLALLVTQHIALAHGFSHFGKTSSEQAVTSHDKNDPQHSGLHPCAACVAFSGFHAAPPATGPWLPMAAIPAFFIGFTVSPAPTFPLLAAYLSRAPPLLLD